MLVKIRYCTWKIITSSDHVFRLIEASLKVSISYWRTIVMDKLALWMF